MQQFECSLKWNYMQILEFGMFKLYAILYTAWKVEL